MNTFNQFTLTFNEHALETDYTSKTLGDTRLRSRLAIFLGSMIYLTFGVLDQWFVPEVESSELWFIRYTALCVPIVVLITSFTRWFASLYSLLLASVGLAAAIGLMAIQIQVPVENSAYYYPGLVLVTFYTYNFIGARFVHALAVDLFIIISYNLIFALVLEYPAYIIAAHDFFLLSANLIGGTAGYLAERQKRLLFIRETELDEERKQHQFRSLHDDLTNLPNRYLLNDRIQHAIEESSRHASIHCGYFLDLDGFKAVNDYHGHDTGDSVLKNIAKRLTGTVRTVDTVARIGGDEFFVLVLDINSVEAAKALANKLLDQFREPIPINNKDINLGVSIGLCMLPYDGITTPDFLRRADQAMYHVKHNGKNNFMVADLSI